MRRSKKVKHINRSKRANKVIALVIILAVLAVGLDIVLNHTSSPYSQVPATSGTLSGKAAVLKNSNTSSGQFVEFNTTASNTN